QQRRDARDLSQGLGGAQRRRWSLIAYRISSFPAQSEFSSRVVRTTDRDDTRYAIGDMPLPVAPPVASDKTCSMGQGWVLVGFNLAVLVMRAIDLGIFHRHAHEVSVREAASWTATWVTLSLTFNLGVYYFMGPQAGLEFLTGYLIEQALSVDNIFV